jgi:hypothetical protein
MSASLRLSTASEPGFTHRPQIVNIQFIANFYSFLAFNFAKKLR